MKLIVALDSLDEIYQRLEATSDNPHVVGYKLGTVPALEWGLGDAVTTIRSYMRDDQLLIYDHQKAGNDIPHIAVQLARLIQVMDFDKLILFPIGGDVPVLEAVIDTRMPLIVGFHLSHLDTSHNSAIIVVKAAEKGVRDFVIPWKYRNYYDGWFRVIEEPINRWYVGIGTQTPIPEELPADDYLIVGRAYKEILARA